MSEAEFRALYERLRRASAWVPADRRGALNNITMSDVVAAAGDVMVGRTVSLAAPIQGPAADNPDPAVHHPGTTWAEDLVHLAVGRYEDAERTSTEYLARVTGKLTPSHGMIGFGPLSGA